MSASFESYSDLEAHVAVAVPGGVHLQKELEVFEGIEWSARNEYERKLEEEIRTGARRWPVIGRLLQRTAPGALEAHRAAGAGEARCIGEESILTVPTRELRSCLLLPCRPTLARPWTVSS